MLGQTLMLNQVHISVSLSLGHLDQSHLKMKNCTGATKSTSRPFVNKKIFDVEEGQNQETIETRMFSVKEWFHFIDWYHQLPEKPLLK